eukprot:CAMPEP_0198244692 /NCGR_PEP_ID=MMETSP1446-20131203/36972_1 /TAXON_ID=1461542 ORGANISM="Unidentified sp, Strain CCMP2111" /NCGR_SAMPLE_ID=MMETSP1446 /ASSEMBLY_ACC=CAM_ASM_001112 /LENGTH=91 /DNA_ID=CAMNT_0043928777 /DNA_START=208 /DNA_END=480 /DNA_ORIENTATION=-
MRLAILSAAALRISLLDPSLSSFSSRSSLDGGAFPPGAFPSTAAPILTATAALRRPQGSSCPQARTIFSPHDQSAAHPSAREASRTVQRSE